MKYFVKFFVVTFLVLISTYSFAEQKIAFIDMTYVLNKSKAGKGAQDYLNKTFKENQKKFSNQESDLKKQEIDLLAKKSEMTQDEYKVKADELRKKVVDYQTKRRDSLEKIATQRAEARKKLLEKLDPILMDGLEEAGFVTFGIAEVGSAYAMGKRAATSMQAARSLKIWTPDGDEAALRTLQAFGISPIPSPIANVLTGLQTGLFDTVTSPPVAAVALQWHTQVDYLLDMPLMYVYGLFVVSDRQFQKLSQIDQVTVRNIMGKVVKEVDKQNRSDHVATFDLLLDMGVERLEPSPQEREEWQQSADSAAQAWVDDGIITPAMYEILENTLESDRATFDR